MAFKWRVLEGIPITISLIDAFAHKHGVTPAISEAWNEGHVFNYIGNDFVDAVFAGKKMLHHSPALLKFIHFTSLVAEVEHHSVLNSFVELVCVDILTEVLT